MSILLLVIVLSYANCGIIACFRHSFIPFPYTLCRRSHKGIALFSLKLLDNVRLQILRLLRASPASLDLAILANKELLEVPLNPLQSHEAGLLVLQPLEGRIRVVAVDLQMPR